MYQIGVLVFLICSYIALDLKGLPITMLWNPVAILMVIFVPILSVLTATRSWRTFWRGLKAAALPLEKPSDDDMSRAALLRRLLFPNPLVPDVEIGQAASLFRLLSKVTAMCSVIFMLLSILIVMPYWDDVDLLVHTISSLPGSPIIALVLIAGIYEPAVFSLKKRQSAVRNQKNND